MTAAVEHIAAVTFHGRKGAVRNSFSYGIDYLLAEVETMPDGPAFFSRNRGNLIALHDCDHGGPPGQGRGAQWVRDVLDRLDSRRFEGARILLMAQPRVLGHVFNPVSFWWVVDTAERPLAVIAEVTNTFGDRHAYLCVPPEGNVIAPDDTIHARKILHVSPFQPLDGGYAFNFRLSPDRVDVRILYQPAPVRSGDKRGNEQERLLATVGGARRPLGWSTALAMLLRRPLGSRRVLALIHWQALKLWVKGAPYRRRPHPASDQISVSDPAEPPHGASATTSAFGD